MRLHLVLLALAACIALTAAFAPLHSCSLQARRHVRSATATSRRLHMTTSEEDDPSEYAEAKIVVTGQAYGGYFRAHARNEAHYMRKLCGALKEFPDRTEIVVEGKRSAIDGFMRWCKRGPGLSQQISQVQITYSEYTGIFDR
jgi:acylphosphatase